MSERLAISEVFGPTIQGEGRSAGQRAMFVRLAGCNLTCVWCDTPYTWDWERFDKAEEVRVLDQYQVRSWVAEQMGATNRRQALPLIVISGGEPLLQRRALNALVSELARYYDIGPRAHGLEIEIETNGTVKRLLDDTRLHVNIAYNVSPKLAHSGVDAEKRAVDLKFWSDTPGAIFKYVCQTPEDVETVETLIRRASVDPARVWIMPEGVESQVLNERAPALVEAAVEHGFNFTGREHIQLWGDSRGK